MGQKVIPIGFRLVRNRKWRSMWYASKQDFGKLLVEDQRIREHLRKRPSTAGVSSVNIRRMSDKIEITVRTSRPGLVIGKKGAEIDQLRKELRALTGKEVWIEVEEIKRAEMDAKSVADNIARQLERRMPFRRVMKKSLQATKEAGALGVKIRVSGRLGGAEIARAEWYKDGQVPLHTLKADIDYATARAQTTYGIIGVKVWINHGEEEIGL
jgi:small subunit ribosomal protein S3